MGLLTPSSTGAIAEAASLPAGYLISVAKGPLNSLPPVISRLVLAGVIHAYREQDRDIKIRKPRNCASQSHRQ